MNRCQCSLCELGAMGLGVACLVSCVLCVACCARRPSHHCLLSVVLLSLPLHSPHSLLLSVCLSGCDTCTNSSVCLACTSPLLLSLSKTSCDSACARTTYDAGAGECRSCLSGCDTCVSSSTCDKCTPPLLLSASKASCAASCPAGSFDAGAGQCALCLTGCASCNTTTQCQRCSPGLLLSVDKTRCDATCAAGSYDGGQQECIGEPTVFVVAVLSAFFSWVSTQLD